MSRRSRILAARIVQVVLDELSGYEPASWCPPDKRADLVTAVVDELAAANYCRAPHTEHASAVAGKEARR